MNDIYELDVLILYFHKNRFLTNVVTTWYVGGGMLSFYWKKKHATKLRLFLYILDRDKFYISNSLEFQVKKKKLNILGQGKNISNTYITSVHLDTFSELIAYLLSTFSLIDQLGLFRLRHIKELKWEWARYVWETGSQ